MPYLGGVHGISLEPEILVKLVVPEDYVILGHLERRASSTVAPLMDRNLARFIMRGCISIEL